MSIASQADTFVLIMIARFVDIAAMLRATELRSRHAAKVFERALGHTLVEAGVSTRPRRGADWCYVSPGQMQFEQCI